jgi:hypothetical protein
MNDTIYDAPRPIPGSRRWQRETLARVIATALMEDEFDTDEKVFLHGLGQVIDLAHRPDPRPGADRWVYCAELRRILAGEGPDNG